MHCQYVHMRVRSYSRGQLFLCSAVYSSPHKSRGDDLWAELGALSSRIDEPWFFTGDFNVILNVDERQGGQKARNSVCHKFSAFMFNNNISNLGFDGPKFTWQ